MNRIYYARVAKLADAGELDSPVLRDVQVRILPRAHQISNDYKLMIHFLIGSRYINLLPSALLIASAVRSESLIWR